MTVRTFRELFADGRRVEIPIIQRDYAQGRDDARSQQILDTFLRELRRVLVEPAAKPLDLDFVYGRWRDEGVLEPLDGQQRLTTLFLVHWYLAQRDGCQDDLRAWLSDGAHCRFSYRTRASAEELLDELVKETVDPASLGAPGWPLSRWLTDRAWFLRGWLRDPTVRGCLRALDAIHALFADIDGGYERLTSAEAPPVFFHVLHLADFGLSDDLYVKMNARGKPLTGFEIFKAEFEQYLAETFPDGVHPEPDAEYFAARMDREWTDFVWRHRDPATADIDVRFVQLIRVLALVHLSLEAPADDEELEDRIRRLLTEAEPSLRFYQGLGCLGPAFVVRLVRLFDRLAAAPGAEPRLRGRSDYFDEAAALVSLFTPSGRFGMTIPEWAKLAAWVMYLLESPDPHSPSSRPIVHEWMRVVRNLVESSDLDRVERLAAALPSIARSSGLGATSGFLEAVAKGERFATGLNRDQRLEEQIKAQLIQGSAAWRSLLEEAETHPYFRGDVQFLLRFSGVWDAWHESRSCDWSEDVHDEHRRAWSKWYAKVLVVFPRDRTGLGELGPPNEHLLERALLCRGDYLLRRGPNLSLLDDQDRDASWKRLLRGDTKMEDHPARRAVLQSVLADLDPNDPEGSLRAIVDAGPSEDAPLWRRLFARDSRLVAACWDRMLRFQSSTVFLLRRTQMNGRYVDLYTYALYLQTHDRWSASELPGFEEPQHPWIMGGADLSRLTLSRSSGEGRIEVTTEGGSTVLRLIGLPRGEDADGHEEPLRLIASLAEGSDGLAQVIARWPAE